MFDDEPGENWVGSPKMRQIRKRLKNYEIQFDRSVFISNPHAKDLVSRMLSYEENMRPLAEVALAHEWFAGMERRQRSSGPRGGDMPPPPLPLGVSRMAEHQRPSEKQGGLSIDPRGLRESSSQ